MKNIIHRAMVELQLILATRRLERLNKRTEKWIKKIQKEVGIGQSKKV